MGTCSQTSGYLKVAVVGIIVAAILHIAGLATYNWATLEMEIGVTGYSFQTTLTYLIGLWKHCICLDLFGQDTCECSSIDDPPGWLSATKALAGIACTGMFVGGILAFIAAVMTTPNKQLKIGVVIIVAGTGVILIAAIIVFGIESKSHMEQLLTALEYSSNPGIDFYSLTKYGFSFILSTIAACILLAVCVPLLTIDLNQKPKQINNMANTGVVQNGNQQVQIIAVPVHQGTSYGYPGMQPMQPPAYSGAPPLNPGAPPPQGLYHQQQFEMTPTAHQPDGIPPKS